MNATSMANTYKTQQIMTAAPEELTLMLYNGAIRFVAESIAATENGDFEKANNTNLRAQDIIKEFMSTLDMQYEISHSLMQLYDYLVFRLVQGNLKKDPEQLKEVKGLLSELRDTWYVAMKDARPKCAVAR